jgi:hypothetical protein
MIVFFRTKALSVYRRVSVSLTVPFSFRCEIPPAFAAFGIVGYNGRCIAAHLRHKVFPAAFQFYEADDQIHA